MPSNAFTFRMPAGIPGAINRTNSATVEAQVLDTVNFPTAYGVPVAIDATSNKTRKIIAGDTPASIYGMYVRPFPTGGTATDPMGVSTPPVAGICNVLKRGYIMVQLGGTAPAVKNGTIYVRVANAAAGKPLGGIEAASDATNTIAIAGNSYFSGPADANGNVEIAFNI